MQIRLGTRQSPLAKWQAKYVAERLRAFGHGVELVFIKTLGDESNQQAIPDIGAPGVFTKRLQDVLLAREIDLAVHSLKDLPTEPVTGLKLAAVPPRGLVGDVLLSPVAESLETLPEKSVIGTGSVRRQTQIQHRFGERFVLRPIRGNIGTRLEKLFVACEYDALILAEVGIERLGLCDQIRERISLDLILPAVGQGALGLEIRAEDTKTAAAIFPLDDLKTHAAIIAERAMLSTLQGGCIAPIAALAVWGNVGENEALILTGRLLSQDGSEMWETRQIAPQKTAPQEMISSAIALGKRAGEELICQRNATVQAKQEK